MTRRVGRTLLVLLLLVIAGLGICEWQGWPFLRGPLERTLSKTLERPVAFGDEFELHLLGSIRLSSDLFSIGAAEGAPLPEGERVPEGGFLRATEARLELPWSTAIAMLRGTQEAPTVRALEVGTLDVALKRTADGKTNWGFGRDDESTGEAPVIPRFERLVVGEGHVVLDDEMSELQLEASVRTREGSGFAEGGAPEGTAPGAGTPEAREAHAASGLDIEATGRFKDETLHARMHTSGVLPLIAPEAEAPPLPIELELQYGELKAEVDGRASDILELKSLEGSYRLAGPSLAALGTITGTTLPTTKPFEIRGTAAKSGEVWSTKVEGLSLGSSRLAGEFEYDPSREVPKLSGKLRGKRLALADLGEAFTGSSEKRERKKKAPDDDGRVLPQQEFELPSLARMEADVEVDLEQADLGTDLLLPLQPLKGRITLLDEVLTVDELQARAAGGDLRGRLSLDSRQDTPTWSGDLRWSGIRLERFVTARNPLNQEKRDRTDGEGPPSYVTGVLGGRTKLKGVGNSTAKMLGSLDGSIDLWITDGTISHLLIELMGIDVAQSLGVVVTGDKDLSMRCAVASFGIEDGLIETEAAMIDTSDTTVMVDGEVSLAEERLALVLTARPKDVSLIALRAPVHVEGSFANPDMRPELSSIGLRLAGAALLAAINPLASLIALIDPGDPKAAACAEALRESGAPPGEGQGKGDAAARGGEGRGKASRNEGGARAARPGDEKAARSRSEKPASSGDAKPARSSNAKPAQGSKENAAPSDGIDKPGVGQRYQETPPVEPGVN